MKVISEKKLTNGWIARIVYYQEENEYNLLFISSLSYGNITPIFDQILIMDIAHGEYKIKEIEKILIDWSGVRH